MLTASRRSLFLFQATTTAMILSSRLSVLASTQEVAPEIKKADKIRGAVLGALLADSLSLGRSIVACSPARECDGVRICKNFTLELFYLINLIE
jgi:hypothetical protein